MATSILKELDKYFPTVISNLILDFSNDRNDKFDEVLKEYNNMMKKLLGKTKQFLSQLLKVTFYV